MSVRDRFRFYLTRLGRASAGELVHRAGEQYFIRRLKSRSGRPNADLIPPPVTAETLDRLVLPEIHGSPDEAEVRSVLAGKRFCLNQDPEQLERFEKKWQGAFFTGVRSDPSDPDLRAVWEPARLQHLTLLLVFLAQNPDSDLAATIPEYVQTDLARWIERNPFGLGPHYISVMECALRIPVLALILKTLDPAPELRDLLLKTMFEHAWLIHKRLSLHSSLGNHTVTECLGLVVTGAVFQEDRRGREWLAAGVKWLEIESVHQILDDGGPVEQSWGYHRFVLDLFWYAVRFLEANGLGDCTQIKNRLVRGEEFINAFLSAGFRFPNFGDYDDGRVLGPGLAPVRGDATKEEGANARLRCRTFPQSGYTLLRFEGTSALVLDHGPLGMPPLFNHGHADALSLLLVKNGAPILVDSGTFRYNNAFNWRRYFKSTRAHNTVTVDGLDQSEQVTGFVWGGPYQADLVRLEEKADRLVLEAAHSGYSRLKEPVRHHRQVAVLGGCLAVRDFFDGSGRHEFELNFHFHPEADLRSGEGDWVVDLWGQTLHVFLATGGSLALAGGETEPALGWFSPAYGLRQPTRTLTCRQVGPAAETAFITLIGLDGPPPVKELMALLDQI